MGTVNFQGKPVHLAGQLPAMHSKAPAFSGVDTNFQPRSLEAFKGKKKIICFAPSLDTPVCSLSAKKFNEQMKAHPEAVIIYCSLDLPPALKRLCLSDTAHYDRVVFLSLFRDILVAGEYGVYIQEGPLSGLCARAVFVLSEDNTVIYEELVPEITDEPSYTAAIQSLSSS
ncbi:MAG: thiol peroxidase [Candidatus Rhabdochlamydia sp.]